MEMRKTNQMWFKILGIPEGTWVRSSIEMFRIPKGSRGKVVEQVIWSPWCIYYYISFPKQGRWLRTIPCLEIALRYPDEFEIEC